MGMQAENAISYALSSQPLTIYLALGTTKRDLATTERYTSDTD